MTSFLLEKSTTTVASSSTGNSVDRKIIMRSTSVFAQILFALFLSLFSSKLNQNSTQSSGSRRFSRLKHPEKSIWMNNFSLCLSLSLSFPLRIASTVRFFCFIRSTFQSFFQATRKLYTVRECTIKVV